MKNILGIIGLFLATVGYTADVKISQLPLGSAATTGSNDSFPYVSASLNITKRLNLWDIVNLPSMAGTFAPLANPTFTGVVTAPSFVGTLTGNASNVSGIVLAGHGGTGLASVGTSGNILTSNGTSWVSSAPATNGTVTSVGFSVPASSVFAATGSPVTSSGTLGFTITGVSGGIPYFDTTSTLHTSSILVANQILVGGGAGSQPTGIGSLGTATTVLHGNASGGPTFGAVSLTTDVSGVLPVANGGTNLSSTGAAGTVLRSNGTAPSYAYPVVNPQTATYSATLNDDTITGATNGGAFSITLPTAVGHTGKTYKIVKSDTSANLLTVTTTSSQTLWSGGPTSTVMHMQGDYIEVQSDGANWMFLSNIQRSERASINCLSGGSGAGAQSGTWLASIGARSGYSCQVNFVSGVFSVAPQCNTSVLTGGGQYVFPLSAPSTSSVTIGAITTSTGGSYSTDYSYELICQGPR